MEEGEKTLNHIIQYFYKENINEQSEYGVNEQNYKKKNEYYYRCILDFYYSSIYFNRDCKHYFVTNDTDNFDFIDGFDFKEFCSEKNIEIIERKSRYVVPRKKWAGSLYFFDAVEAFEHDGHINCDDSYFFFDNDILFNKSLSECINKIGEFQYLVYNINHEFVRNIEKPWDFNGIDVNEFPKEFDFFGGEFFGIKGDEIKKFIGKFNEVRLNCNFYTEEHYISYIISEQLKNTAKIKEINTYLKRCWTTVKYSNVKNQDSNYAILHLPSEKQYGLYWYSDVLIKNKVYDPKMALSYCSILKRTILLKVKFIIKKVKMQFT